MNDKNTYLRMMNLSTKTIELLLVNLKNMHSAMLKDCADKQRIGKLIIELETELMKIDKDNQSHIRLGTSSFARMFE